MIELDLTSFGLAEFVRAKQLAAIGKAAALEQIPKIKQPLAPINRNS